MKLMKKLMAALSVLCLVGMLAACGGGAGGGAGGGEGNGGNPGGSTGGVYTVVYGDETLDTIPDEDFADFSIFFEERQDYTLEGKTIRLNTNGYTKFEVINTLFTMMADPTSIDPSTLYTVVYEGQMVSTMPYSILPGFVQMLGLSTPDDYTIDEESKTITLTASGYQKGGEFYAMISDEEDD